MFLNKRFLDLRDFRNSFCGSIRAVWGSSGRIRTPKGPRQKSDGYDPIKEKKRRDLHPFLFLIFVFVLFKGKEEKRKRYLWAFNSVKIPQRHVETDVSCWWEPTRLLAPSVTNLGCFSFKIKAQIKNKICIYLDAFCYISKWENVLNVLYPACISHLSKMTSIWLKIPPPNILSASLLHFYTDSTFIPHQGRLD